jgi:hypothetical protein
LSSRSSTGRILGAVGLLAPPAAVGLIVAGGFWTPGYDPTKRTISRLAVSGLPAASVVELAICLVGFAAIALAIALGPGSKIGRSLLAVAGGALLVGAAVRLDPGSAWATTEHRLAASIAIVALAGAPVAFAQSLWRRNGWAIHGRVSLAFGAVEVGLLLAGMALLPTSFGLWGLWERSFLALPVVWMLVMSWRLLRTSRIEPMFSSIADKSSWAIKVSADDTVKAAAASQSRGGE